MQYSQLLLPSLKRRKRDELPLDTVIEIRELRAAGNSLQVLADKYGMRKDRVCRITTGASYANFPGPITKLGDVEPTHCIRNHPWATEAYVHPKTRKRKCRACQREKDRQSRSSIASP